MISQPRSVGTAIKMPSHGNMPTQKEVTASTLLLPRLQQVVQGPPGPVVQGLQGQLSQAVSRDKVHKQQEGRFQDQLPQPLPVPHRQLEETTTMTTTTTMIVGRVGDALRLARLLVVTVMIMVITVITEIMVHLPNVKVFLIATSSVLETADLHPLDLAAAASLHSDAQCTRRPRIARFCHSLPSRRNRNSPCLVSWRGLVPCGIPGICIPCLHCCVWSGRIHCFKYGDARPLSSHHWHRGLHSRVLAAISRFCPPPAVQEAPEPYSLVVRAHLARPHCDYPWYH